MPGHDPAQAASAPNKSLSDAPTRRDVLIGAGLTAGTWSLPALAMVPSPARADHASSEPMPEKQAAPFKFGSEPPRLRKSAYDLTEAEVSLFCDAVSAMRD